MTGVFEYLDYQFVRDGYTGKYSVYQNDRTIGQELDFIDAQAAADSDFRLRYPGHRIFDQKPRAFRADGDLEKAQNSANTRKYLESQDRSTETLEKIKSCTKALDDIPFKLVMSRKDELSNSLEKLDEKVREILEACQ